jgi:hypothetical protein
LKDYTIPTFSDIVFGVVGYKVTLLVNNSNILEIAIQLLPIDEAELRRAAGVDGKTTGIGSKGILGT